MPATKGRPKSKKRQRLLSHYFSARTVRPDPHAGQDSASPERDLGSDFRAMKRKEPPSSPSSSRATETDAQKRSRHNPPQGSNSAAQTLDSSAQKLRPPGKAEARIARLFDEAQSQRDSKLHAQLVECHGILESSEAASTEAALQSRDAASSSASARRRATGVKLTPLEKQVSKLKLAHPDKLLAVEVGYKYKFFGNDADTASSLLDIYVNHRPNIRTASIPTHRLAIHMKRLVDAGHKVAVVGQTETAAIKKFQKSGGLFAREITALYTKATMIDEVQGPSGRSKGRGNAQNQLISDKKQSTGSQEVGKFIMCVWERPVLRANRLEDAAKVHIAVACADPASGEVIWDNFKDDFLRAELETRLLAIRPAEILLAPSRSLDDHDGESSCVRARLSTGTRKLLNYYRGKRMGVGSTASRREVIRKERYDFTHAGAARVLGQLWKGEAGGQSWSLEEVRAEAPKLSNDALVALGGLAAYLSEFKLASSLREPGRFNKFTAGATLELDGMSLRHLCVLQGEGGVARSGGNNSLLSHMCNCSTAFGSRMLRRWVSRPLTRKSDIEARLDAVSELLDTEAEWVDDAAKLLPKLPDLDRSLQRIGHRRCDPIGLWKTLFALRQIDRAFPADMLESRIEGVRSELLADILTGLSGGELGETVNDFMGRLSPDHVEKGDLTRVFRADTDTVSKIRAKINAAEAAMQGHLRKFKAEMKVSGLKYKRHLTTRYLVEVSNTSPVARQIPRDWLKVNATKRVTRYHPPEVLATLQDLERHEETLRSECKRRWDRFLVEFIDHSRLFSGAVANLARLDCLLSLRQVAAQPGYCRPRICDDPVISLRGARHPVVEAAAASAGSAATYVPNDLAVGPNRPRALVITGPNMGGKSSFQRTVALVAIMAQVGSFVPCDEATVGCFDGIYTRMGASDCAEKGLSTFLVEMAETATILGKATRRSLVLIDELGRGTSTHDGTALAMATLHHLAHTTRCVTLFTTHYLPVARLALQMPGLVSNFHMGFKLMGKKDGPALSIGSAIKRPRVAFLYKLVKGVCPSSYGINVARLADLPETVVAAAERKSDELKEAVTRRRARHFQSEASAVTLIREALDALARGDHAELQMLLRKACASTTTLSGNGV